MAGYGRRVWVLWGAGLCAIFVSVAAAVAAGHAASDSEAAVARAYSGSLTRIVTPAADSPSTGARVKVTLRSRAPIGSVRAFINGRRISLRRARAGVYTVTLPVGGLVHQGVNLLTVSTTLGGRFDFDATDFVVARPVAGLVGIRRIQVGGYTAPVTVVARMRPGATVRVRVNGHDASNAFAGTALELVGLLGANDGLRHGVNRVVITAYTASGRRARVTTVARRFAISISDPIAGAGLDRSVLSDQLVKLDATRSLAGRDDQARLFRWQIVSAPARSRARLVDSTSRTPVLQPDFPGTYRIRLRLLVRTSRGASPAAARQSTDTVILRAQPNDPYGVPLESNATDGAILLRGRAIPHTTRSRAELSYAVISRWTLEAVRSGHLNADAGGLQELLRIAEKYSTGESVMVFNWDRELRDLRGRFVALYKQVGGSDLPADDKLERARPGSVIGIPGAKPGVAFLNHRDSEKLPSNGDMSGLLRLNAVTGLFDFVFASYVPVDTFPQDKVTSTNSVIAVGNTNYNGPHGPSSSGFHVLTLDAKSLKPISNASYTTNNHLGKPAVGVLAGMAADLQRSADEAGHPLVVVQSFGTPEGSSPEWGRVGLAIQRLGGTAQVFDDLNQPYAGGPGGDPTGGRKGGYAFIGRIGSTAPLTEASQPLDRVDSGLKGLLMRSRSADYEPMTVAPPSAAGPPVNEELVQIANARPTAFPPLDSGPPLYRVQAAEDFLGGPQVMDVCPARARCDVRETYIANYRGSWQAIATNLSNAREKCRAAGPAVRPDICEEVREQLFREAQAVARVQRYLGSEGLKQPFGAAGVTALANLGQISTMITNDLRPPTGENTTLNALSLLSVVMGYGAVVPGHVGTISSGLGAVFALGGYMTTEGNGPDLIGPQINTSVANLGVELAKRYETAGGELDGLGELIVADYGKLMAVAGKVDSNKRWQLKAPGKTIERAAKRTIYEVLIPKAYPVLYDLGRWHQLNARNWNCYYKAGPNEPHPFSTKRRDLFKGEPDEGQVVERFPENRWDPVMAVGGVDATGRGDGARIPTPSGELLEPLFKPTTLDGLGMKKLEFYTPRLFRLFPADPKQHGSTMSLPFPSAGSPACDVIPSPPGTTG